MLQFFSFRLLSDSFKREGGGGVGRGELSSSPEDWLEGELVESSPESLRKFSAGSDDQTFQNKIVLFQGIVKRLSVESSNIIRSYKIFI